MDWVQRQPPSPMGRKVRVAGVVARRRGGEQEVGAAVPVDIPQRRRGSGAACWARAIVLAA